MESVSVREMKELEHRAIKEIGIPSIVLMENAGRAVSGVAVDMLGGAANKRVAVFCGPGNNGGDGFVASRYLSRHGVYVSVYLLGRKSSLKPDPAVNANILENMDIQIKGIAAPVDIKADLIIDAIFGLGLKSSIKEPARSIVKDLNTRHIPILSVDVPSGLDADTGEVLAGCVRAKKTATMQFPKRGFYINSGPAYVGEIAVLDIGIPR